MIDDGDDDWWWGECNEMEGWFSTSFIEVIRLDNPIQYFQEGKVMSLMCIRQL